MSQPYGQQPPPFQQGYNPQYNNPYQQAPPPPGWNNQSQPGPNTFVPPPPPRGPMDDAYVENGLPKAQFGFNDISIRQAFIRKVFTMVAIMLAVVTIMAAIPFMHQPTQLFIRNNIGLYWAGYGIFLVVYFSLICCESTLSMGYMTMVICSMYNIESVLMCLIITTVCCGGIILFSMQTRHDLTSMMGFMFIASMVLMLFGLMAIIGGAVFHLRFLYTIYAGLAALLFMVYLAIDIQMIMGGRKYEISPEDHIFAAIQLFMDIVMIFWMLLALFGGNKD